MQSEVPNGNIFLRLLLNKFYSGKPDSLLKIMPPEDAEKLSHIELLHKEPNLLLFVPKEWLGSMDGSWLMPTIEKLSKPLQEVYKRAFPAVFDKKAQNGAGIYNATIQDFLISYLHSVYTEKAPPPKNLLPEWELTPLLAFSRQELLDLVDLIAIHDLVEEMRHIVDKKLLQSVLQYLTVEQQHYLRVLLRQKSRGQSTQLSVRELLKEGKKFPQLLHRFGLIRLATACSGASQDFLWHILHTFDLSRAKFLQNHIKKEEVPNQTQTARLQVQHILQFLKTETTT